MSVQRKLIIGFFALASCPAVMAGSPNSAVFVPHAIPAVGQPGLIALAFIVGIVGARLIQKAKSAKQ